MVLGLGLGPELGLVKAMNGFNRSLLLVGVLAYVSSPVPGFPLALLAQALALARALTHLHFPNPSPAVLDLTR